MKLIRVLGIVQLVTYVGLFAALAWPVASEAGGFSYGSGFKEVFLVMYGIGGATLVPSALAFIDFKNALNPVRLDFAKSSQKILFIACCVAALPILFISMSAMYEYKILLVATLVGVAFYPITVALVKKAQKTF